MDPHLDLTTLRNHLETISITIKFSSKKKKFPITFLFLLYKKKYHDRLLLIFFIESYRKLSIIL